MDLDSGPTYPQASLLALQVREDTRGKGVGKTLCKRCEDTAKEWGFMEMLLLVEEQNIAARELYKKLGYVIV